jgi:large repetitive protein
VGATVEIFDGATSFGTTVATAAGTWSRAITVPSDGAYLLSARARTLGATSPSSSIRVIQVDTRPPAPPVITAPATTATMSFTLTGTAEPGTTIEVLENGSSRGTVAAPGGSWTKSFTGVPLGVRSYTAIATDIAGNRSTPSAPRALAIN